MRCLVGLYRAIQTFFNRKGTTTFYQVRVGDHMQWITTDQWQRQMKENEINKILLGGTSYGSRYNQIESVTILPLSNFSSSKKCNGKTRKD